MVIKKIIVIVLLNVCLNVHYVSGCLFFKSRTFQMSIKDFLKYSWIGESLKKIVSSGLEVCAKNGKKTNKKIDKQDERELVALIAVQEPKSARKRIKEEQESLLKDFCKVFNKALISDMVDSKYERELEEFLIDYLHDQSNTHKEIFIYYLNSAKNDLGVIYNYYTSYGKRKVYRADKVKRILEIVERCVFY